MKILILQEGKYQGQTGYHFTSLVHALDIVKSNEMHATNWSTSKGMWKDMQKSQSWSITRNQGGIKYRNFNKNSIRFDINLWKLSNNQKIKGSYVDSSDYKPIQYDWKGNVDSKAIDFEYEMRPLGNTKNFSKYVDRITICLETNGYNIKSKVENYLVSGDSSSTKDIENELNLKFPELMELVNSVYSYTYFRDLLLKDIDNSLTDSSIGFSDYIKSNNFKFNYTKLIKDCNSAIDTVKKLTSKQLSFNIKDESDFDNKVKEIIMNNNIGGISDFLDTLASNSNWKNKPVHFVDTKGISLFFRYRNGISIDYEDLAIYKKLTDLETRYTLVLKKDIWQYIEGKRGVYLLREINPDDSFVQMYDTNTDKRVYVPATDKDDIKELKLILKKGKHSNFELDGNGFLSSEDIVIRELAPEFKKYSNLKKKEVFYVADSFNQKKFLAFIVSPKKGIVKGMIPFEISTKSKKL